MSNSGHKDSVQLWAGCPAGHWKKTFFNAVRSSPTLPSAGWFSNFSNKVPQYTAGGHSTTVCGGLKFHFMSLCFNRSACLMVKQNLKPLSAAITSELGSCQEWHPKNGGTASGENWTKVCGQSSLHSLCLWSRLTHCSRPRRCHQSSLLSGHTSSSGGCTARLHTETLTTYMRGKSADEVETNRTTP